MVKRNVAVMLALLAILLLAGCGKNAPMPGAESAPGGTPAGGQSASAPAAPTAAPASSASPSSGSAPVTAPATGWVSSTEKAQEPKGCTPVKLGPLKKGDNAKLCPVTVTLKEVNTVTTGVPQGYAYVLLHFTILNDGPDDFTINTMDHFKLTTPEGKVNTTNATATSQRNPRLQGTLAKGASVDGWIGYLSKLVAGNYEFHFEHPDFGGAVWTFALK